MTALVAIMNKEAVAIAADSAATIGNKIYNSANKVFMLSKHQPVSIMLWQKADFMDYPLENIIKEYRKEIGSTSFGTLMEYSDHFLSFLETHTVFYPEEDQEKFFADSLESYFQRIVRIISRIVKSQIETKKTVTDSEIKDIVEAVVATQSEKLDQMKNIASISDDFKKSVFVKREKAINQIIDETFEKLPLSEAVKIMLYRMSTDFFFKEKLLAGYTGIVVAGYGSRDVYPSLYSHRIQGIIDGKLVAVEYGNISVTSKNDAVIMPFAQEDTVRTFIDGINPNLEGALSGYLKELFQDLAKGIGDVIPASNEAEKEVSRKKVSELFEQVSASIEENIQRIKLTESAFPIIQGVGTLPKTELAMMAETLVQLTSFKRKITATEEETVGGPIDVALISRGDGFVWIKRKHYFQPELNHHFFSNYFRKES